VKEIYWLDRIKASERHLVGDRAMVLSQLGQQGYPIVPGFAIGSLVLKQFFQLLHNSDSLLTDFPTSLHFDVDNHKALQLVASQSRQIIIDTSLPSQWLADIHTEATKLNSPALILHPSIAFSKREDFGYASLLRSHVCCSSAQSLSVALKQVWAELFTSRSLFYIRKAGLDFEQIELAVLVQPLTDAIASGTATIANGLLEIRSTWGLEDSLILGEVLPDFYQIQLATKEIITQQIGIKTRAYRLQADSEASERICLETHLLSESEQETYSLDQNYLSEAIEVFSQLEGQLKEPATLGWTLIKSDFNAPQAEFYITQYFGGLGGEVVASPHKSPSPHGTGGKPLPARDRAKIDRESNTSKLQINYPSGQSTMENAYLLLNGIAASPGVAIAPVTILNSSHLDVRQIPAGTIIVAKKIEPAWLPLLKKAAGLIVEGGGITSHGAILARETNIPAIVAAKNATKIISPNELVSVNGHTGAVYRIEGSQKSEVRSQKSEVRGKNTNYLLSTYPIATQLMVNISQPSSIAEAAAMPVDGIGLLRSELMLLDLLSSKPLDLWSKESQRSQLLEYWTNLIAKFAAAFAPRPVFYRSLDLYAADLTDVTGETSVNSLLGGRGTYNYAIDPSLFDLELEALLRVQQQGYGNLKLILPFVRSVEEFSFCRDRIENLGLHRNPSFQIWMMAEVPSVIFLLSEYVKAGVQGIAIGTNDLTQLLLGIDREVTYGNARYNPTHPAMIAALQQLIQTAKDEGIPCSICGQATVEYPELIDRLIEWGITAISTELEAIESVYRGIARAEQRLLLELARARQK
jgi:pyruvate,water dikinase